VTGRALVMLGGVVVAAMTLLMFIGTTSMALFVTYGLVWVAAAGVLAWGLRREKAETFARLERERRGA